MLDHFQTEDDRELTVVRRQIVVGRAGMELEFGMGALRLRDPLRRRIDAGHVPAAPGQFVGDRAVAAAEFEQAALARRQIQPVQQAKHGGQQVAVGTVQAGVVVVVAGNGGGRIHYDSCAALVVDRSGRGLTGRAGFPAATVQGSMSWNTLERAVTTAPSPIVTPGATNTSAVTHARSPRVIGAVVNGMAGSV